MFANTEQLFYICTEQKNGGDKNVPLRFFIKAAIAVFHIEIVICTSYCALSYFLLILINCSLNNSGFYILPKLTKYIGADYLDLSCEIVLFDVSADVF